MTDDLIKRLRKHVFYGDARLFNFKKHSPLAMEAADRIEAQANTIEELRAANERWVIAFKLAEERANGRIEALLADNAKMRKTLEQIAYGGAGVPYGCFGEPLRAYQLQRLAIAALQETER